ncbi:MAG: metallophosphoesterase, partial [Bacilli bacterium]|nr:metallophosphoesterase [Bacilli bacterium]
MRKFIISDIHGLGNIYKSIMYYLDNISTEEDIELYVNGDLFDRGPDSASVLLDLKKRIEDNKYKIIYLGGNHELLMHEVFEKRRKGKHVSSLNDWYMNGGEITDDGLCDILNDENKILEVADFVSNLYVYHKFDEKINRKNIVLVHAACPLVIKDECDIKIKDLNVATMYYVWAREEDPYIPFRVRIGHKDYFTIVGHTPNNNRYGYVYHDKGNFLNIDGGCAPYAKGYFSYNHVPLVEVCDCYLKIITFNNNNEITYGNYFTEGRSSLFT